MNRSRRGGLLLGSMLAGLVACDGGGGGGGPISLDEYATRYLAAYCKLLVSCRSMPDQATCMASEQELFGYLPTLEQDISAGNVAFDGAKARHCVELIEGLPSCKQSQAGAAVAEFEDDCRTLFTGTAPTGGGCFFSEECASGHCTQTDSTCSRLRQCCAGTCADVPAPIPAGGDCTNLLPGQSCAPGSSCTSGSGLTFVCMVPSTTEGAACTTLNGCRVPLFCDLDPSTGTGTCKRPAPTGGACKPGNSHPCDDGRDVCDATTDTCTPKGAVGADCTPETCVGWARCDGTTCVARPRAGETCDPAVGPACLGGLVCDATMTCALTPGTGVCS